MFDGEEFKYFVAFVDFETNEILHLVGYMEQPAVRDVLGAIDELKNDEDFGMDSNLVDSLMIRIFSFA